MMRYVELDKKEYKMVELTDLKVKDYKRLLESTKQEDEIEIMRDSLRILTDMPDWMIDSVDLFSLMSIDWTDILQKELRQDIRLKRKYTLKGIKYTLHDFERLSFGRWIDIDSMISTDPENMSFVIAVMLHIGEYDIHKITKLQEIIEEFMSIQDAYSIWYAFINWRTSIFKQYRGLFKTNKQEEEEDYFDDEDYEEEDEETTGGNQWLDICYSLTNEDITKKDDILARGIIEILNWLGYLKDKRDAEEEAQKNAQKNRIH